MNTAAKPARGQGPPVAEKKPSWTKRCICFFLPKRFHRYVTPEFIVAWNVSNYVTWGQAYVLFKWKEVSAWLTTHVVPHVKELWLFVKSVTGDIIQMINHTN